MSRVKGRTYERDEHYGIYREFMDQIDRAEEDGELDHNAAKAERKMIKAHFNPEGTWYADPALRGCR